MNHPSYYQTQTTGSILYGIIVVCVCTGLLATSEKLASDQHSTFSCKGVSDNYFRIFCLEAYNKGPNDLQRWFYYITLTGPISISLLMIISIIRKNFVLKRKKKCKIHIHQLYFSEVFLRFLFHFCIMMTLVIRLWAYRIGRLTLESTYTCLTGNVTLACVDGTALAKSETNIVCFLFHILMVLFNALELVYYGLKWHRKNKSLKYRKWECWEDEQSDLEGECEECTKFKEDFFIFAGMLSNLICFVLPIVFNFFV